MHTHTHTLYSVCVSQLISEALSPRGTTVWLMAAAFTPSASLWESKMAACFHRDNRRAPLLGRWMKILRVPGEADGGSERKGGHGFSRSVLLRKKPSLMMMHVLGSPGWCPAVQKSITELVTSFLCSCVMFWWLKTFRLRVRSIQDVIMYTSSSLSTSHPQSVQTHQLT